MENVCEIDSLQSGMDYVVEQAEILPKEIPGEILTSEITAGLAPTIITERVDIRQGNYYEEREPPNHETNPSGISSHSNCGIAAHIAGEDSTLSLPILYEVEKIVDYQREEMVPLYLVKWKGWDSDCNTWEPHENLKNCDVELSRFYYQREAEIAKQKNNIQYISKSKGSKRRKVPVIYLQLPPNPRPIKERAQEFYEITRRPSTQELEDCEMLWRASLNSRKKLIRQWPFLKLDKALQNAMCGKLSGKNEIEFRQQLLLYKFEACHSKLLNDLKNWEVGINQSAMGMPTITVENNVDFAGRPADFTYTIDYIPTSGIEIPDDPPMGCGCTNCFHNRKGCCAPQFNAEFAYSANKRLRVVEGSPIYECNKRCPCGPECPNRVVQDGNKALKDIKLTIYRTSNGCGWGVKTLLPIKKGTFVSLYVGEVILAEEADARSKACDSQGTTYLFDLDFNEGDSCPYAVDATKFGNVSHFFNHSCDPNLAVFAVWVNCLDPNLPKLALFAIKDIPRGTQLTFDYKSQISNSASENDQKMSEKNQKKPCLCGASNCRLVLF